MIFSLEMPKEQLANRMMCSEGRVGLADLRKGQVRDEKWNRLVEAAHSLSEMPIWIDDSPSLTVLELRGKVRRQQHVFDKKGRRIGLVIVDYLQLMRGRDGVNSREQEISEISRGLKALAKELRVPVIALSQLNRAVETRAGKDKRPQLSDLRESGAIEQDADVIQFIQIRSRGKSRDLDVREPRLSDIDPRRRAFPGPRLDRCAIYAPNRVEWMTAALAIQAAGGVMVPIYGSSTADQAAYVAEHADAKVVFVDTAFLLQRVIERWTRYRNATHVVLLDDDIDVAAVVAKVGDGPSVAEVEAKIVTWSQTLGRGASVDARDPAAFEHVMQSVSLDQPGVMLYTSGTSGNPKGVPLTHRNVGTNGRDWLECNAPLLREGMVDLLWLPMSHIFGFGEACLGNTLGFTSYLCDPRVVLEKLVEVKPSVLMSVPSIWEKLAAPLLDPKASDDPVLRRNSLSAVTGGALEFCLSGGAGLKREVKEAFHRAGLLIVEGYGLTETSPTLTLNRPTAFRFDTVGRVLPSVEVKLAEDGEIFARGPSVFGGYHKDAVATADAFTADGWFKTGDVGRFTDDGFLQIIDRKKDILIRSRGKSRDLDVREPRLSDIDPRRRAFPGPRLRRLDATTSISRRRRRRSSSCSSTCRRA